MRIFQVLPSLAFGDAVGNDTLALKAIIGKKGYKTDIYAVNIDQRLPSGSAKKLDDLKDLKSDDMILFHMAIGSELSTWIMKQKCRKIMIYHNITPPKFFADYDPISMGLCKRGLEEVKMLKDTFELVFADSEFNKQDLIQMGYSCPIKVLPILIAFDDYLKKPNSKVVEKYRDGITNIVFVGRVAPNKKQEDIIQSFYYYKKYFNPKSRLILVGSYRGMERYYERLIKYVEALGVTDVLFTGHIKFDEILAFYKVADVFLCESEHEGFCVPLVEAMFFDVPIVAYDSCAIKYTLGNSGFLMNSKNGLEVAGVLDRIQKDNELSQTLISNQRERLKDFSNETVGKLFEEYLDEYLAQS